MNFSKSVYQYKDYRKFLTDYYESCKHQSGHFTYKYFSTQAKIKSPNFLKLIMNGKRNLTIETIHCFAKGLKLSQQETTYFETLVLYNQAGSEKTQKYYYRRLQGLKKQNPTKKIKHYSNDLIAQWYYPALILYLHEKNINLDLLPLSQLINVNIGQIKNIIDNLLASHVLEIQDQKYHLNADYVHINQDPDNIIQKNYLRNQLEQSLKTYDNKLLGTKPEQAKFFSHTFTFSQSEWEKYIELIKSFLDTTTRISNEDDPNSIGQLNIQIFKLQI